MSKNRHRSGARRALSLALGAAALTGFAAPAAPRADEISFTLAPYLWITSMSANVTIGQTTATVNKSFVDILRETDKALAFTGYGAVHYGRWSFFLDGLYSSLKTYSSVGPLPTTNRGTTALLDFGLSYRFDLMGTRGSGEPSLSLEPYVGGRYSALTARITSRAGGPLGIDLSRSWSGVDPILGARLTAELDRRWRLTFAGDIGGGAAARFTWSAAGLVGYRFELGGIVQTAWFGYKALGLDVRSGGASRLRIDQVLHGPVLGASFRF